MTGDRFEIFKREGRWYWQLQGGYYPSGPIACCYPGGYATKQGAVQSILSAARAMDGAYPKKIRTFHVPTFLSKARIEMRS